MNKTTACSLATNKQTVDVLIHRLKQAGHIPYIHHSYELAGEIYERFRNSFLLAEEAKELLYILSRPNIRALFDLHDRIANEEYVPVLPDILPQYDDEEQPVKVVRLIKNGEPLGITIKKRESDGVICVARVFVGAPADRSGLIQPGDEVHEVNGIPVEGRTIEEVVHILNSCDGTISLKLVPDFVDEILPQSKVKMRTHFNYDPTKDLLIPCRDAGLPFKSGDILEILNTDDALWWQAKLLYDHTNKSGLVPSRTLQMRRSAELYNNSIGRGVPNSPSLQRKLSPSSTIVPHSSNSLLSPRLQRKMKKSHKIKYHAVVTDADTDTHLKSTHSKLLYEEVLLYKPPADRRRPIVLVGPRHVGTHDLRLKLVKENHDYVSPMPVTCRPKKLLETDGKDFDFISKSEMDRLMQDQRLLEYGEYKGHVYAVTLDSIAAAINSHKTCVLVCQPESLVTLRCAQFKPLVVFIKPPSLEKLKQVKVYAGGRSTTKLTMHDIEDMVLGAARIESMFGKLCDEVITNTEFNSSYNQLVSISHSINSTENWVPSSWLD